MTKKNKQSGMGLTRRTLMKYAVSSLLAGAAAPGLLRGAAAGAAETALQGKNILVAYSSRTGNTRQMAQLIHAAVGGDLVEIKTVHPYPDDYRATTNQAKQELESGYRPPLATTVGGMAAYDVVFVGSPCWWSTIAPAMITFLTGYDMSGKTLVPFMTHKGSGLGRTMAHVRELCPTAKLKEGLAIRDGEVEASRGRIAAWLRA